MYWPADASSKVSSTGFAAAGAPRATMVHELVAGDRRVARVVERAHLRGEHGRPHDVRARGRSVGAGRVADLVVAEHGTSARRRPRRGPCAARAYVPGACPPQGRNRTAAAARQRDGGEHGRCAQATHPRYSSSRRARASTASSIAGVSAPGERVLLAGVEAAEQRARSPARASAPWPKRGRGRQLGREARSAGVPGERAEADDDAHRGEQRQLGTQPGPRSRRAPRAAACWPAARSARRR